MKFLLLFKQTVHEMIENPNEPVNDFSYFDCIESVVENSKMLGEWMSGITQHARASELESFGEAVISTQKSLIGLTEAAAQVIHLTSFNHFTYQLHLHRQLILLVLPIQTVKLALKDLWTKQSLPGPIKLFKWHVRVS